MLCSRKEQKRSLRVHFPSSYDDIDYLYKAFYDDQMLTLAFFQAERTKTHIIFLCLLEKTLRKKFPPRFAHLIFQNKNSLNLHLSFKSESLVSRPTFEAIFHAKGWKEQTWDAQRSPL